jgi:MFS family permease
VFSIIQRHWTGPARARALGHYCAVAAGGVVLGQILGGVLVTADVFGAQWRSVFFVNVPIGLALLALAGRIVPRDQPTPGRRLDLPGLVALAATVLAFVVPLVFGHEENWPAWCWISLGGSALLFLGFVAVQRRVAQPLMPGRLFRAPGMLPALGALTLMMAPYGGYLFSVALHLQNGLGFSPLRAGLTFVPMAVCFAIASLNWRRLPPGWHKGVIPVALVGATVSLAVIAIALRDGSAPGPLFFAAQIPFGLSSGLAYSPTVNQALARVQPADAPDASGLVTTIVQLAQVVGLAGVGSIYLALTTLHPSAIAVSTATFVEAGLAAGSVAFALALVRRR